MNELDIYIPPNIRLINLTSKRFTYNQSFTSDELVDENDLVNLSERNSEMVLEVLLNE